MAAIQVKVQVKNKGEAAAGKEVVGSINCAAVEDGPQAQFSISQLAKEDVDQFAVNDILTLDITITKADSK